MDDKQAAKEELSKLMERAEALKAIPEKPERDPREDWIGKWGFYSNFDPKCPDYGRISRLVKIDTVNDKGYYLCNSFHWRYFRPAMPEELGIASVEPDWSNAPELAQYWAQDKNGAQYWYSSEPEHDDDEMWYGGDPSMMVLVCPNWRNTLRKRP